MSAEISAPPATETHDDELRDRSEAEGQTRPAHVEKRFDKVKSIPFLFVHAISIWGVVSYGWSWKGFALALGFYAVRMFGVTGFYHRYFSHRTYKTSRWFQFVIACWAMTSAQKGVLWWAAHHRTHHKLSDKYGDVHSMQNDGFYWSHVGWILSPDTGDTDMKKVGDLAKYPELVWLNKYFLVPPLVFTFLCWAFGGMFGLLWGAGVSTVMLWHGTFTINSLSHWMGRVRYRTGDESKNSWILALVTLGEGWHNNHHFYQRSTSQGFFWWELDITYYGLKMLSLFGLVWDLTPAPDHVRFAHLRDRAKHATAQAASEPARQPSLPSIIASEAE